MNDNSNPTFFVLLIRSIKSPQGSIRTGIFLLLIAVLLWWSFSTNLKELNKNYAAEKKDEMELYNGAHVRSDQIAGSISGTILVINISYGMGIIGAVLIWKGMKKRKDEKGALAKLQEFRKTAPDVTDE